MLCLSSLFLSQSVPPVVQCFSYSRSQTSVQMSTSVHFKVFLKGSQRTFTSCLWWWTFTSIYKSGLSGSRAKQNAFIQLWIDRKVCVTSASVLNCKVQGGIVLSSGNCDGKTKRVQFISHFCTTRTRRYPPPVETFFFSCGSLWSMLLSLAVLGAIYNYKCLWKFLQHWRYICNDRFQQTSTAKEK